MARLLLWQDALKPCVEPVLLVQKPISEARMIDNIRAWGTGALNIGALQDQCGHWPTNMFTTARRTIPSINRIIPASSRSP